MVSDDERFDWKRPLPIVGVIMLIASTLPVYNFWLEWHDDRYPRREEVVLLAQAVEWKANAQDARRAAENNSVKLDYLVKKAARDDVRLLNEEIAEHQRADDGTRLWQLELVRLQNELKGAENYFECITHERINCDSER